MFIGRDILRPQIALYAINQFRLFLCERGRYRVIRIHVSQWQISPACFRLKLRCILVTIQITKFSGSHHDTMPGFHGPYSAFLAPPHHHRGIRSQPAFHDLVPSQQLTPVAVQKLLHTANQITL